MNTPTETIKVLESLLTLCTDGVAGYRHAALVAKDPAARHFLHASAAKREEIASVLTCKLAELGRHATHHGSIAAAMHRHWLDAVALVERGDTAALLHACERGERETLAGFATALGHSLPEHVRDMVQSLLARVMLATSELVRAEKELTAGMSAHA